MKKSSILSIILLLSVASVWVACKKTTELHPYRNNYRLINFTKKTTRIDSVISDNYGFTYDIFSRVTMISHTTNRINASNFISYLTYRNDTVYDTTRFINGVVYSVDTFVTDLNGNFARVYMGGVLTRYGYLNDLLTRKEANDSVYNIFTSYNGNVTKQIPIRPNSDTASAKYDTTTYTYYTDQNNYPGDYFYLNDMARFGYCFIRNTNLINEIKTYSTRTVVDYTIDAYNRISKVHAVITDTARTTVTEDYDLQYEKYK
ncbi:MAG: hypothetical protein EBX41_00725 [Chitinophagia bacterium]|nr:hypothetical protein [Chitinophagia bacterium]